MTTSSDDFVQWAKRKAIPVTIPPEDEDYQDLGFLNEVIGDAKIVALGESAHYLHEWNRFRERMFKYLVESQGFTTFVLESGAVEGKHLYDYVLGEDVAWETVIAAVTNGWGVWKELQDLLVWMREFNLRASDRPLRFYCMDGSSNWASTRLAVDSVASYMQRVDPTFWATLAPTVAIAGELELERRDKVSRETWYQVIAAASLIVNRLEQERFDYCARTSEDLFDWRLQSAKTLRDLLIAFSQTDMDMSTGFRPFWNVRDVAMADRLHWIVRREGGGGRFVVAAHNTHLQRHPVRVDGATSMGSYLTQIIGRKALLLIGTNSAHSIRGDDPEPDSNQAAYAAVGQEGFFLDFRKAPPSGPVHDWLMEVRPDRHNLRYQPVAPGKAWDCLLYHRTLRIATPALPAAWTAKPGTADVTRFDDYVGDFRLKGFLGYSAHLTISREGERLFADGRNDLSGELFPPLKTELFATDDGRFGWPNWPAYLTFLGDRQADAITIALPGMDLYEGVRV